MTDFTPPADLAAETTGLSVRVEHVTRRFGRTLAVDDLSFSFGGGNVFAFVGPNGAGKTTTMRMMATLDVPDEGRILIDDLDVAVDPEQARRRIGYMPDNLPTHRDVDVADYLDFFARSYGLRRAERLPMIADVVDFTNLGGILHKSLRSLSKGMKQRVSLARALIHDPDLLIMDEPAAGLDPRARVELRELIRALTDRGKAVLISSHILTELAEIADGAVIIERGRLIRAGALADLVNGSADAAGDSPNGEGAGGGPPQATQRLAIRVRDRPEDLRRVLLETPNIREARPSGRFVEAVLAGDEDDACDLLAELLRKEFRILEFKQVEADLERLFMDITRGDVQ